MPSGFFEIFEIAAVIASILCLCFFVVALVRQFKPGASGYRIFAWTDGLLGIAVTAYAVYDILTDIGWFAGILGSILLIVVVPVNILLLVVNFVLYKRNKKRNEAG